MKVGPDPRFPVRPEFRDYLLARSFGYTREEIDDQPAVWLDWLLAIDGKMREVEADAHRGGVSGSRRDPLLEFYGA